MLPPRTLRLLLFAAFATLLAALLWFLLGALNGALALWRELAGLPALLRWTVGALFLGVLAAGAWVGLRLLRPRARRPRPLAAPDRPALERRVERLLALGSDTAALQSELLELDRRRATGDCHVALFGEISSGKSSLLRALAPQAQVDSDVLGGTTRQVAHWRGMLDDGRALVLADVPGSGEVGSREREQMARDEALRAHAVVVVADADLTRAQDTELRWLAGFGKPLLLALNKIDRYDAAERATLLQALQARYAGLVAAVVAVSAGGTETLQRVHADGRREPVQRERPADVAALRQALQRLTRGGAAALEESREAAVLAALAQRLGAAEAAARQHAAAALVDKYTRRAVLGALAAVAPGSDLVIQGVLASGLLRELAALHGVPVREIDLDAFLARAALTVRTATTVLLAIAGNALKAFPGLGTLGGGVVHAIAYGLVFDSLGRAVADTLATQHRLDADHAAAGLRERLGEAARERLRHVAALALREGDDTAAP